MNPEDYDDDPWPMGRYPQAREEPRRDPREPPAPRPPSEPPLRAADPGEPLPPRDEPAPHRHRTVPDFVRRAIENTMGSMQSTQTVSREALQSLLSTTDKTRKELVKLVAHEVGDFFRHVDVASEITKILTSVQADVQIKVRFRRNEEGKLTPEVSAEDLTEDEDEE